MSLCEQNGQAERGRGQRMDRRGGCGRVVRKTGAMRRRGRDGSGAGLRPYGGHPRGHRAMVRSVTAAAGWEARVVFAGRKVSRKRPQPEEQNQENGNAAPHLEMMLHDRREFK